MSSSQKRMALLHDDLDLFLEFLGAFHEDKWKMESWYDLDSYLEYCGKFKVIVYDWEDDGWSVGSIAKFTKYVQYQLCQYTIGKSQIVSAFEDYKKIYGKKTREVSVQTEVSLDQNKKYYGPKVL
jgi:hypothetical protein